MNKKRFHMNFDKYAHQIMCDGEGLSLQETVKILNEQQDKITELEKNFDDLVEWASEITNRNVVLDEQIGRLQQEIRLLKPTNIEQYEQIVRLQEENEQLRQKLECCEYEHFKKELDKIHERVEKGDLSDFCTLTISDKGLEHWNGVLK